MYSARYILPFVRRLKKEAPTKDIWIYSGFTFEEINEDKKQLKLLSLCDVLVDGLFVLEKRDTTLSYKGSCNQRIIDVQRSIKNGSIVQYTIA